MRVVNGHRAFDGPDTYDGGHEPGDRHVEGNLAVELTGADWAPVCPICDISVDGRDAVGYLTCGGCGKRPADLRAESTS